MDELDATLPENGVLRAEWLLLSAYLHFPVLEKMLPIVREAAVLFGGTGSGVILPEIPWAFYEYTQITAFHFKAGDADREADMLEEFVNIYSRITGGHGNGADALFRAEIAFLRGETAKAEIFAYKAAFLAESKKQKIIQLGAARLLASIALLKGDADGWQKTINTLEHTASGAVQNSSMFRTVIDVVRGSLLSEVRDLSRIAEWLKNDVFLLKNLPVSLSKNAMGVHAMYMICQGDVARLVGQGQAQSIEGHSVYSKHVFQLMMAVGYSLLGDRAQSAECCNLSAKEVLPDGMIHYFAGFSPFLQGISDKLIENNYPQLFARYKDYKEQYIAGWYTLYNANVADELPSGLTGREREIAILAADGLRNSEIAEKLFVSENTVRAHLRSIYQKLDIDRRAKLAGKLK
jgi:LuxR family maltose regulon positive regulatory protein